MVKNFHNLSIFYAEIIPRLQKTEKCQPFLLKNCSELSLRPSFPKTLPVNTSYKMNWTKLVML